MSKIVYDKYNNVRKISKHITKTDQKCSSRCALTFSYGLSDCSIQNNGDHIELSYDPNVSTVIFNSATYKVSRIGFYAFGVHQQYGSRNQGGTMTIVNAGPKPKGVSRKYIVGELIIEHKNAAFGDDLLICVPVIADGSLITNRSSPRDSLSLLDEILQTSPRGMGEKESISVQNYNLSEIIPKTAYYYYYSRRPYGSVDDNVHCIVMDSEKFSPPTINLKTWQTIISVLTAKIYPTPSNDDERRKNNDAKSGKNIQTSTVNFNDKTIIQHNASGSGEAPMDDIYIDCKPTGEETKVVIDDKMKDGGLSSVKKFMNKITNRSDGKFPTMQEIMNNAYFQLMVAILMFFVVWQVWSIASNAIQGKPLIPGNLAKKASQAVAAGKTTTITAKNLT